jgi:hypothetical protein
MSRVVLAIAAILVALGCQAVLPAQPDVVRLSFFVSPAGNDAWSGRTPEPNEKKTDGPLATPARAREVVREAVKAINVAQPPPAGSRSVTVYLRGGTYQFDKTLELGREDCPAGARLTWAAWNDEEVRLVGGRRVVDWKKVTDPGVLARLSPEAAANVLQADLKAMGIADFGSLKSRGFSRPTVPAHLELFFRGRPMTLARWPNKDFARITAIPKDSAAPNEHGMEQGKLDAGFFYEGDRPRRWKSLDDVWLYGYWAWDWAASYEKLASVDLDKRLIRTAPPFGNYGFRVGQRFCFLNVLEELDEAGEYYLDRSSGILYFWPPEPIEQGETWVSLLESPMIVVNGTRDVTLQGLTLECTRGRAVQIKYGQGNVLKDCTLRNIGNDAVYLEGGRENRVEGCHIADTGDTGIHAWGGDRKKLEPCGHVIENNHLHHIGRWTRCYVPAVSIDGVGIRVAHNLIHDHPHAGMLFTGNDHVIEFNEIHHVALETGDVGAIYTGRDWTYLGNVIRHNYIHDVGGVGMGSMGVYIDDCAGGMAIFGNVFRNVQRAVFIGGGRHNAIANNVFIDCRPAVQIDGRGLDKSPVWHDMVYKTMKQQLEEMNYTAPPYSARFPELLKLTDYLKGDKGVPPEGNTVLRNVCVGGKWLEIGWHATAEMVEVRDNLVDRDPLFVDPAAGNYQLRDDSPAFKAGFKRIPVEEIGLIKDKYRLK